VLVAAEDDTTVLAATEDDTTAEELAVDTGVDEEERVVLTDVGAALDDDEVDTVQD